MKVIKQVFLCGLIGALFGGIFGVINSPDLAFVLSAMGIVAIWILYGLAFFIIFMKRNFFEIYFERFAQNSKFNVEFEVAEIRVLNNQALKVDEHGNPRLDPQWLMRGSEYD